MPQQRKLYFALLAAVLIGACATMGPVISYDDKYFSRRPELVERDGQCFLCYEFTNPRVRPVIESGTAGNELLFHSTMLISAFPDSARIQYYRISEQDRALTNHAFWLNPDGTKVPLQMREDALR